MGVGSDYDDEEIVFHNEIASIEQAFHYNPLGEGGWEQQSMDVDEEEIVF